MITCPLCSGVESDVCPLCTDGQVTPALAAVARLDGIPAALAVVRPDGRCPHGTVETANVRCRECNRERAVQT